MILSAVFKPQIETAFRLRDTTLYQDEHRATSQS